MAHKNYHQPPSCESRDKSVRAIIITSKQTRMHVRHCQPRHYVVTTGRSNETDTPMMAGCRVSRPAAVTRLERACSAGPGCLLIAVPPVPHPWPGQAAITMCAKPSSSLPGTRGSQLLSGHRTVRTSSSELSPCHNHHPIDSYQNFSFGRCGLL